MEKNFLFCFIFSFFLLQISWADNQVIHYQLKNGLNLYVKVDKRAPVVISQIWYKVGSSYESNGLTGISHVLEHMMFQGTNRYPNGEFSEIIAANGGEENAATSYDFTDYYQNIAANKLPISFKLEADRMQNLSINERNFSKEIKVVREERRLRLDNNPQALTYERFMAAAFIASPYHHPIIGWMSDLQHMTVHDVRHWYKTWYAPNNAIVVVVGDVNPSHVFKLAQKYFGPISPHPLPVLKPHPTLSQIATRKISVNLPAKLPFLIMGYNVPSMKTTQKNWIPYALDLTAYILSAGNSARFPKDLIRNQQVASAIDVDYDPFARLGTLFIISAVPNNGHTLPEVQKAILAEIQKLKTTLVSSNELTRIKTQLLAQETYDKDSLVYQAEMIGRLESVGLNWRIGDNFVKDIDKITPQQIQEVVNHFFNKNRLTIAYLHPVQGDIHATS